MVARPSPFVPVVAVVPPGVGAVGTVGGVGTICWWTAACAGAACAGAACESPKPATTATAASATKPALPSTPSNFGTTLLRRSGAARLRDAPNGSLAHVVEQRLPCRTGALRAPPRLRPRSRAVLPRTGLGAGCGELLLDRDRIGLGEQGDVAVGDAEHEMASTRPYHDDRRVAREPAAGEDLVARPQRPAGGGGDRPAVPALAHDLRREVHQPDDDAERHDQADHQ